MPGLTSPAENEPLTATGDPAVWTLAYVPTDPDRVKLYVGGVRQIRGLNFLLNVGSRTVTFLVGSIPPAGETPVADYPWSIGAASLVTTDTSPSGAVAPRAISQITNHSDRAIAHLLEQYKNQPLLAALIRVVVDQVQEAENGIYSILSVAVDATPAPTGARLDLLGKIVGEARAGKSDASYLIAIRARILINRSNGLAEEVITLLKLLTQTTGQTVQFLEEYPAAFVIRLLAAATPNAPDMAVALRKAKSGGVGAAIDYYAQAPLFGFDGSTGNGFDTGYMGGTA